MSETLKSEQISTRGHGVFATLTSHGAVMLSAYGENSSALINLKVAELPALIAFLQSCTPAESAEGTR